MTEQELTQLFVIMDSVWGDLDAAGEDGYRFVLAEFPADLVGQVVTEFAHGQHRELKDVKWLPKPPEIAARVHQLLRERQIEAECLARVEATQRRLKLVAGEVVPALKRGRRR